MQPAECSHGLAGRISLDRSGEMRPGAQQMPVVRRLAELVFRLGCQRGGVALVWAQRLGNRYTRDHK
jgi:hypothetical protein